MAPTEQTGMTRSEAFDWMSTGRRGKVVVYGDTSSMFRVRGGRVEVSTVAEPYWHIGEMPEGRYITHEEFMARREAEALAEEAGQ